jgi:serine/threonine protein kinase
LLGCTEYTSAIDNWSVGCILAELIGRKPLFPGDDYITQIGLIVDVLGSPTIEDLAFVQETAAVRFIRNIPPKPRVPWAHVSQLAHASPEAHDLLDKLLSFSPTKRVDALTALRHPYLKAYHSQQLQVSDRVFQTNDIKSPSQAALRAAIMDEMKNYRLY